MTTALLIWLPGALLSLALAVMQRSRLSQGIARISTKTAPDIIGTRIMIRKFKQVENGLFGIDWLPSDLIKVAILGSIAWIVLLAIYLWYTLDSWINKLDGNDE